MPTEMTMRDHFAAAALTGLLAARKFTAFDDAIVAEPYAEAAYCIADAMLRERGNHFPDAGKMAETSGETNHDAAPAARASLPTADHAVCRGRESGCGTGGTPAIDRLREWERHGSGRWGLGAAGDVTMLERRIAVVEALVHGASPEARARTDADRGRTDKADSRPGEGTGDTPVTEPMPKEKRAEGSAEPVAWEVYLPGVGTYDIHSFQWEAAAIAHALLVNDGAIAAVCPLYRHPQPTLTDAEREAVARSAAAWEADARMGLSDGGVAATLRGLLERTK